MRLIVFLIVLSWSLTCVLAARPNLVSSHLTVQNISLIGEDWKVAYADLEFDQPLFLNEMLRCPLADLPCPQLSCTPCDWTSFQPLSACQNANCCGPKSTPESDTAANLQDWCDPPEPFEVLEFGRSAVFTLNAGETAYYRVMFPASMGCVPFRISTRYLYGNVDIYVSNRFAMPGPENNQWDAKFSNMIPGYGFGQTEIDMCPNFHANYAHGTYAVAITAILDSSWYFDVLEGPSHPLPAPTTQRTCANRPPALTGPSYICIEDGDSYPLVLTTQDADGFIQAVFPHDAGCFSVGVSVWPDVASQKAISTDADIFCFSINTNPVMTNANAFIGRYRIGGDQAFAMLCPEQPGYFQCAIQPWFPGLVYVVYDTHAPTFVTPIAELPLYDFSVHSGLSSSSLVFFNGDAEDPIDTLCVDWFSGCNLQWPITPSQQPPLLWPTSVQYPTLASNKEFYSPPPYLASHLNISANHIVVMMVISGPSSLGNPLDRILDFGSITIRAISNADREVPLLPNDGPSSSGFPFPNIAVDSIPNVPVQDHCDPEAFQEITPYILEAAKLLSVSSSLDSVLDYLYQLNLYMNSLAYSACAEELYQQLGAELAVVSSAQVSCPFDQITQFSEWQTDPCCNLDWNAFQCCKDSIVTQSRLLYSDPSEAWVNETCTDPLCAASYFSELVVSLNTLLLGSGCADSSYADLKFSLSSYRDQLRACRTTVGLGAEFAGVSCQIDADCPFPPFTCNRLGSICLIPDRLTTENNFLACFIDSLSISFEDWLRVHILPSSLDNVDKSSPEFLQAMREAVTVPDCVSDNILDIDRRNREIWDSSDRTCEAGYFGVDPTSRILIAELCPPVSCLDSSCIVDALECYRGCLAGYSLVNSDEETCATTECTTASNSCTAQGNGHRCVFCDSDGDLPCIEVPNAPTSQDQCESLVACILPDAAGTITWGLTASQCAALPSQCSQDCATSTPSTCQSLLRSRGSCRIPSLAGNYNGCEALEPVTYYFEGQCFLSHDASQADCNALASLNPVWETCESLSLAQCTGGSITQRYLQCYPARWAPCTSESSCLQAGYCTDRPFAVSFNEATGASSYGACFSSGYYQDWILDFTTECYTSQDRIANGCRSPTISSSAQCPAETGGSEDAAYQHQVWLDPATTRDQCQALTTGRYGCLTIQERRTLWFQEDDCIACGGKPANSFEWIPGQWRAPIAHPLTWVVAEQQVPGYQWQSDVVSFMSIENLVNAFVENQATFGLRSLALCQYSLVDSSVRPLSCSCLSHDTECFSSLSPLALVGLANPCLGKVTDLQTPSARLYIDAAGVESGCVELQLSEVNRESLRIPPRPASVSFSLGPRNDLTATVQNRHGFPVGELVSNGLQLSFDDTSSVDHFTVCIHPLSNSSNYSVPDFGTSSNEEVVIPLGTSVQLAVIEGVSYWCGGFSPSNTSFEDHKLTFFLVFRLDDFESPTYELYSEETTGLVYTLGALYCLVFVVVTTGFFWVVYLKVAHDRKLPIFAWAAPWFLLLCIFRIVYCFAFPSGTWDSSQINNFVVFELPTFFYFTAFVIILSSFISALNSLSPDTTKNLNRVLIVAVVLIWLLFISVAIAVGVISSGDTLYSPCPGRVASESTIDTEIRNLSIAYQSIVITFIFLLALSFFLSASMLVHNVSRAHKSVKRAISILKELFKSTITIVLGFLLRCILFLIILAADFESSIYMFITLVITEIIVILLISILWWRMAVMKHRQSLSSSSPDTSKATAGTSSS